MNGKQRDCRLRFEILSAGWARTMRTAQPEPPKEPREPVTIRLPAPLMKSFRMAVLEEHGSYAGGWLSFEAERALRAYLLLVELSNEVSPDGATARRTLERATA